jgi:hypothetical protein
MKTGPNSSVKDLVAGLRDHCGSPFHSVIAIAIELYALKKPAIGLEAELLL